MPAFDANDFGARLRALLPQSWFSASALSSGGNVAGNPIAYALTQGFGASLATAYAQIAYAKMQTRLATATDSNLDAASTDLFGTLLPRNVFEPDSSFSARIRQQVVLPLGTLAAIQAAVKGYLGYNAGALQAQIYQLFGLDTYGGLDTFGGLDGFNAQSVIVPKVVVFDQQSNPTLAAQLSIAPPQFCVLLLYNAGKSAGFFAGRSFASRDYVVNTKVQTGSPLTTALDAVVRSVKAVGTIPIYASNYH